MMSLHQSHITATIIRKKKKEECEVQDFECCAWIFVWLGSTRRSLKFTEKMTKTEKVTKTVKQWYIASWAPLQAFHTFGSFFSYLATLAAATDRGHSRFRLPNTASATLRDVS